MNINSLSDVILQRLKYLGLTNLNMFQYYQEYPTYKIGFVHEFNPVNLTYPETLVDEITKSVFEAIENSPFIADLRVSYQKEIQTLKEEIQRLQELNMNLSEGITNGIEYLELHADGVKAVKE